MIEIQGKYNTAKVFTDNIEQEAISQIIELCNQEFVKGAKVRIMPDVHSGAGCVIGFTADLGDKVIPNIVGVDIGCGMLVVNIGKIDTTTLQQLDTIIRKYIPSGMDTHDKKAKEFESLKDLYSYKDLQNIERIENSIGTLGGGNHFIEVNIDSKGDYYLVIHSGSRNLGKQVAEIYQKMAIRDCTGIGDLNIKKKELIEDYKANGKQKLIQQALKELEQEYYKAKPKYPEALCFLTGENRDKYLHDMKICQEYAVLNRETIAEIILDKWLGKKLSDLDHFTTIHNYINFKDNIIRKGAISAYAGERVIIPMNMRDGDLLCVGKGNPEWNYSAPHGAGRLMSRSKAKQLLSMEEYQKQMEGIFTTSVSIDTIDEAPMAYKSMQEIIDNIGDTVDIVDIIKPVYNFKASE